MTVRVFASSSCNASWDKFKQRVEERRAVLENARNMNVKRLQQDVQRIAQREATFAKQLLEEIVPVKVEFDENAWKQLVAVLPVRIVPIQRDDVSLEQPKESKESQSEDLKTSTESL